ncbi:MAG: carboxypeptidase regulatory-like domain-containing protein [Chloracidobacterium sp.]
MTTIRFCSILLWLGWLALGNALGQQTSVVAFTITDASSQKPLAGATITLTPNSSTPMARALTRVTDAAGKATFTDVPGGIYTLVIAVPGYDTLTDEQYAVEPGVLAEQPIGLSLTGGEVVEVRGDTERPLVEQGSGPSDRITPAEIRILPARGRDILTSFPPVPNVIRSNDGRTSIKGAREDQSAVLVNGNISNDPATGAFQVEIPLEAVERAEVFTNPYLPEFGKFTGGVTRVETRPGNNKWQFGLNDFFPEPRFRGGKLFGFANVSPRVNVSGPIVRDKAFFAQAFEFIVDKAVVRGLPNPDNEVRKYSFRSFSQFDVLLTGRQTLTSTVNVARRLVRNVGLDFFNPVPVSPNQRTTDIAVAGTHRYATDAGSTLETHFNYKRIGVEVFGKGAETMVITPLGRSGSFFTESDRTTERYQLQFSNAMASFEAQGWHRIKFGFDVNAMRNRGGITSRPVEIRRADGTLLQRITYANRGNLRADNIEVSGYAQDQWLIRPNLQLDFGLRIETQQAATSINFAPRVALSYAPGKTDSTVLRAGFGLFYDKLPLNALAFRDMPRQVVTTFNPDGTIRDPARAFVYDLARDPTNDPGRGGDFRVPFNRTFRVEFAQRVTKRVLTKLAYLDSRTFNDLFIEPILRPTDGVIRLFNTGRATYRAFEATADIKFTNNQTLTVSYVRSKARAQLNDFISYFGDIPNPVIRPDQFGNAPIDAPNRFFARGVFALPWQVKLAPIFEWRDGFPFSLTNEAQDFIGQRNADTTRFPRFMALDLAVTKTFTIPDWLKPTLFGKKSDIRSASFTVSIFNITNNFNPRNVFANTGAPQFGTFFAVYRRFYRIDFNVNF